MAIDMSQFYQVFFEESAEHLATMEALLLALDVDEPDAEQLNAIFRAAHSIKGSSGTFGFTDLAATTHILENLLDRIRKHELVLRPDMVDAFLETGDLLKDMLAGHQGQGEVDPHVVEAICERLRRLSTDEPAAASAAVGVPATCPSAPDQPVGETAATGSVKRTFDIQFVPTTISAQGDGVKNFIDDLRQLGELEILCQPDADAASPVGFWELRLKTLADPGGFTEQIDFIADNGAWRVSEDNRRMDGEESAFGFFGDAPGAPAEDCGYGFFEPLAPVSDKVGEDGDGYGFFAPLPAPPVAVPADEEGDGYGFFAPLPAPAAISDPSPPTGGGEEGEGYGFFAPLPPVLPTAPTPGVTASVAAVPAPPTAPAVPETRPAPRESTPRAAKPPAAAADSSIRVSVEKVDQLINLVGELVITQAMLLQTAVRMEDSAPERLLNGLAQLERNTRDLQESVMSIRMLPISFVFSRFPRVVRDLSGKLGKQVELKTTGETTELDKSLIERIADPLTHLIRNSLDHGIELPEARVAAGKNPVGTITLKAYHQGGNIVIEVGDDGAGLNRQKILAKAREKGLPVSDQMSDQDVFGLIFDAGFSTAEQVTDVSGRGVGMDVVRKNIQAMGGASRSNPCRALAPG